MKIQCSCGTKYAFDVTPEMVANPIRFVCQNCGADNSAAVNALIQQQFAASVPPTPAPPPAPIAVAPPPAPAAPSGPAPLKVKVHAAAPATTATATAAPNAVPCHKHPGQFATQQCLVCHKPMCPKCMELFGYVCSPLCKNDAEARGINVPVYAKQASAVQAAGWKHFRLVAWSIVGAIVLVAGLWGWYEFGLSRPRLAYSFKFTEPSFSGGAKFVSRTDAVVLHGGRLARHDFRQGREIWSANPIDKKAIAERAAAIAADEKKSWEELQKKTTGDDDPIRWRPRDAAGVAADLERAAARAMHLHVSGRNIWLRNDEKMVRFDWDTGKPGTEIALSRSLGDAIENGPSLLLMGWSPGGREALRVDLETGQTQSEKLDDKAALAKLAAEAAALATTNPQAFAAALMRGGTNRLPAAPPLTAARTGRQGPTTNKMSAFKVGQQDSFAAQIAAPAIVAAKIRNDQITEAMKDDAVKQAFQMLEDVPSGRVVNAGSNLVQFSVKLLEKKTVERQAMKAPPKKSALNDANLTVAGTLDVANEMMNEWQRERTGGVEVEDVSRYEVSLKRLGTDFADWTGEVTGEPAFFSLGTVDLLVAGKSLTLFDKQNKKLWQSPLNYEIAGGFGWSSGFDEAPSAPGVEHKGRLYFFDRGVLTCFDLASGNVHWRLPSVGVSKVMFDARDMLYVETTTASADSLKFSQQVDLSRKTRPLLMKVDSRQGKILWKSENNGRLAHIAGKIIYTLEWNGGDEEAERSPLALGTEIPPHVRVRRLDSGNGKVLWQHYQKRAPVDVRFQDNTFQLVFKRELQVLKFLAL